MNKYELHTHTKEGDIYAECTGSEIALLYKNAGYDGVVITNHYFAAFYDWFEDEFCKDDHESIIDRYLKGYRSAKKAGEEIGLTVLCGAEVRLDGTENDYLVYGLQEDDFYRLPLLNKLENLEELIKILPDYAAVVQAHPFRDEMTVCGPRLLFGIEGYNGCNEPFRNEMAKYFAAHYGKRLTSGSDFHSENHLARGGIATNSKIHSAKDLVDVLYSGNYLLIENKNITEKR